MILYIFSENIHGCRNLFKRQSTCNKLNNFTLATRKMHNGNWLLIQAVLTGAYQLTGDQSADKGTSMAKERAV